MLSFAPSRIRRIVTHKVFGIKTNHSEERLDACVEARIIGAKADELALIVGMYTIQAAAFTKTDHRHSPTAGSYTISRDPTGWPRASQRSMNSRWGCALQQQVLARRCKADYD